VENKFDLEAFKAKAKQEKKETRKIFLDLKKRKAKILDQEFAVAHDEVFANFDCLNCANCCKTAGPRLLQNDIDRMAKHLRLKPGDFMDQYVKVDEDGDWVMNQLPCPFLGADNYCSIYEVRPKACREYPHTDRNRMHQILNLTEKNASLCPAVFEISRKLKAQ
tara:strand:- start:412 stop:903 length:492 start_codon:yes stop_codon:yes gene_type:complete